MRGVDREEVDMAILQAFFAALGRPATKRRVETTRSFNQIAEVKHE